MDLAILHFCKAFDMVLYNKLLFKLKKYGVNGQQNDWISNFLNKYNMEVIPYSLSDPLDLINCMGPHTNFDINQLDHVQKR